MSRAYIEIQLNQLNLNHSMSLSNDEDAILVCFPVELTVQKSPNANQHMVASPFASQPFKRSFHSHEGHTSSYIQNFDIMTTP
jgi:hypothetical protein